MTEPSPLPLAGKTLLITGAARRIGRALALAAAHAGGDIVLHYAHSASACDETRREIESLGRKVLPLQADLNDPEQTNRVIQQAMEIGPLYALVNNAAIFEPLSWDQTDLAAWNRHLMINLTAPFLLSQAFARSIDPKAQGRIINILDWRAQRPGPDHLPYTISKAALAALTRSLAAALAPGITVNGIALGAILPPYDGDAEVSGDSILSAVPAGRWAELAEVEQTLLFLLTGPTYITGEIIHVDGGRHLV